MSMLGELSATRFLREHWQRAPLVARGVAGAARDAVDGDSLAGLACEGDVESRLVLHDRARGAWHCEHGPFDEDRFAALPAADWTLLVQGAERFEPRLEALAAQFDFLPRWRIDDVMVSYAARGGGVGPHFDHYDVFLVQAAGRRRWRLGPRCTVATPLAEHADLRLLAHFDEREAHVLEPGDMLYVPAGLAHWGEAESDGCITCSVGFRAPSHAEVLADAAALMAAALPDDHRHRDRLAAPPDDPWRIDETVVEDLLAVWRGLDGPALEEALGRAFGCLVTAPAAPAQVEVDGVALPADPARLEHHPHSRFAYRLRGEAADLFVDGEVHATTAPLARAVCAGELTTKLVESPDGRALLETLLADGSLRHVPPEPAGPEG